ncbi:hypothetical protein V495_01740 [Pseudogymnoascus sp. VKM F-4514 (FW-929)]|nr:hypothetical protein V495_01740 [Pseudogymnoascus sp. VKM F-4514 (FW-929)]KFY56571.1 hypothetical protein V497_06136 [Pseudogymnoascus sp. VKM F-4516 (FW-969)]
MSSSKVTAKQYIIPQDFFYCIDFFAQPKNRRPTSSTSDVQPKLKLTMDAVSAIEAERRTERRVLRWLDALPDTFSRVPGDSRSKVRAAQLEQLEREKDAERDALTRMILAQHQQQRPQFNNVKQMPPVNIGVSEYLSLIEPELQQLHRDQTGSKIIEVKEQRQARQTEKQTDLLPPTHIERSSNEQPSKEKVQMEKLYQEWADLPPADTPPPPIPPRSLLRPRVPTFAETSQGTTQTAEPTHPSSSQYSSVDVLPKEATASGTSGVVRNLEAGIRRDNPGLVAELRLGMERRRQRERAKDEELEKEREQEASKTKVWALKLWK